MIKTVGILSSTNEYDLGHVFAVGVPCETLCDFTLLVCGSSCINMMPEPNRAIGRTGGKLGQVFFILTFLHLAKTLETDFDVVRHNLDVMNRSTVRHEGSVN